MALTSQITRPLSGCWYPRSRAMNEHWLPSSLAVLKRTIECLRSVSVAHAHAFPPYPCDDARSPRDHQPAMDSFRRSQDEQDEGHLGGECFLVVAHARRVIICPPPHIQCPCLPPQPPFPALDSHLFRSPSLWVPFNPVVINVASGSPDPFAMTYSAW